MSNTSNPAAPLLEITDLRVRIPLAGGHVVHAVTDATVSVAAGQLVAVVGESGCGKSMIASAVCGILPPAKVTGHVNFLGQDITRTRSKDIAGRHIALIPQSAATFLTPVRTVGSQLKETITALDSPHSPTALLARAGLDERVLDLYPHELSGGMAQRCAIAFALVGDPELIVADEPTASLDPERTTTIFRMLRQLADEGAGVLLITHDISDLIDTGIADEVAVMYASRIVERSPDALTNPTHRYTRDLLAALPENGMHPMPGSPPSLTDLEEDYSYATRCAHSERELRQPPRP